MTTEIGEHDWLIPSLLWETNGYRQMEFFRPALFEYQSDEFMEEFLAAAGADNPLALKQARLQPPGSGKPNKLFQSVHGSFYLAAASLCCREPGFPDRALQRATGERAAMVLRKLVGGKEYGWVVAPVQAGAAGKPPSRTWKPLGESGRSVLPGEERLPATPVRMSNGRQLFCGYIPTGSGQTYEIPPEELAVEDQPLDLPVEELASRFITPIHREPGKPSMVDRITDNQVARDTSVFLLVDLWEFFKEQLPAVACALAPQAEAPGEPCASMGPSNEEKAAEQAGLVQFLNTQPYKGSLTLAEALRSVAMQYTELNATGADLNALGFNVAAYSLKNSGSLTKADLDQLKAHVKAALPEKRPALQAPKLDISSDVQYVLRFVYERPQCNPPITEVSLPSQPFTFAPFFDPDAPARPIKIPLPADVSIAGLRKFKKNVTFVMSDAMRKKMECIAGQETDLLQGPITCAEDGPAFAFICQFSIQIIFIVAFMLLMVFVVVFNLIFWWLAFFKICLPVPKKFLPNG